MAGDWMKIDLELPDKPEVHYIAGIISESPESVVGRLIKVWGWFNKHTLNGDATGVTFVTVDRISGVNGFGEAMHLAGWLDHRGTTLSMPKFDRHTSESAKKRALTKDRMKRKRDAATVTESAPEKRREEKIKTTTGAAAPDPVKEEIWKTGKVLLTKNGFDVKLAGSFLGKLCKEYGQILVLQAVRDCVATTPAEPHTWLVARCQERRKDNGKFNPILANKRNLDKSLAAAGLGAGVTPPVLDVVPDAVHVEFSGSGNH